MIVTTKNAVFWDVALCSSCVNQRLQPPAQRWLLTHRFFYPEDGGDIFLRNVASHKNYGATCQKTAFCNTDVLCKALHPCALPITEQGLPSMKLGSKAFQNLENHQCHRFKQLSDGSRNTEGYDYFSLTGKF
jgi:hypothetical protein